MVTEKETTGVIEGETRKTEVRTEVEEMKRRRCHQKFYTFNIVRKDNGFERSPKVNVSLISGVEEGSRIDPKWWRG